MMDILPKNKSCPQIDFSIKYLYHFQIMKNGLSSIFKKCYFSHDRQMLCKKIS